MIFYTVWQALLSCWALTLKILYLIQTEIIDFKRIQADKTIMTSSRWMSEVKPHPIWKFYRKKGASLKYATYYLVCKSSGDKITVVVTQFIYTIFTLLPVMPAFSSFEVHAVYLACIFVCSIWNGGISFIARTNL
jgi:hypothetical protein